jgi:hypothetical protein
MSYLKSCPSSRFRPAGGFCSRPALSVSRPCRLSDEAGGHGWKNARVIARLICWLFGHDVWESPYSRRHRCERCGQEVAD